MSLTPIESDSAEMLPNAGAQPDTPAQPAAGDAADPASPTDDPNTTALDTPPSTPAVGKDSTRAESLSDFIDRMHFEHGAATPAVPAPAPSPPPPPGGNVAMRLWARMEPDLELQTGGKRVATYEEIHESLHNAARAEGIALPATISSTGSDQQGQPTGAPATVQSTGQSLAAPANTGPQASPVVGPGSPIGAASQTGASANRTATSSSPTQPTGAMPPASAQPDDPDIVVKGDPAETAYVQSLTDEEFSGYQDMENWLQSLEPQGAQGAQRDDSKLGVLSTQYETGGRGPGTVSTGIHDPGGISYGSYQFASKTRDAELAVASPEFKPWAADFKGLAPGTKEFGDRWKEVAKRDAAAFQDAQHTYTKRTHYDPAVSSIKASTRLDLDGRSEALRNVVWSVSVQHWRAVRILRRAVNDTDMMLKRTDPGYDKALIDNIYHDRVAYVTQQRNALLTKAALPKYAQTKDPNLVRERNSMLDHAKEFSSVIKNRYPPELAQAQKMLADEQGH